MDAMLKEIINKFGIKGIMIAASGVVLFAALIWTLAHFTAAPGKEVSILWGFVKYTKNENSTIPSVASDATRKPLGLPDRDKNVSDDTSATVRFESISVNQINGVSQKTQTTVLNELRKKYDLREISSSESGKIVEELPEGVFFFIAFTSFKTSTFYKTVLSSILESSVKRFPDEWYFEVHHYNKEYFLIGYISELVASDISTLSGNSEQKIVISPLPWGEMTTLVYFPIQRIQKCDYRKMEVSAEKYVIVLDAVLV